MYLPGLVASAREGGSPPAFTVNPVLSGGSATTGLDPLWRPSGELDRTYGSWTSVAGTPSISTGITDPFAGSGAVAVTDNDSGGFEAVRDAAAVAVPAGPVRFVVYVEKGGSVARFSFGSSTGVATFHVDADDGSSAVDGVSGADAPALGSCSVAVTEDVTGWWTCTFEAEFPVAMSVQIRDLYPAIAATAGGSNDVAQTGTVTFYPYTIEYRGSATLSVTNGTVIGTAPITYSYDWQRNGSSIGAADAPTYQLQEDDFEEAITCEVTATNAFGVASADSNALTVTTWTLTYWEEDLDSFVRPSAAANQDPETMAFLANIGDDERDRGEFTDHNDLTTWTALDGAVVNTNVDGLADQVEDTSPTQTGYLRRTLLTVPVAGADKVWRFKMAQTSDSGIYAMFRLWYTSPTVIHSFMINPETGAVADDGSGSITATDDGLGYWDIEIRGESPGAANLQARIYPAWSDVWGDFGATDVTHENTEVIVKEMYFLDDDATLLLDDEPRIDAAGALVIESPSANVVGTPEDFSGWTLNSPTVDSDYDVGPAGGLADRVVFPSDGTTDYARFTFGAGDRSNSLVSMSGFVKSASNVRMTYGDTTGATLIIETCAGTDAWEYLTGSDLDGGGAGVPHVNLVDISGGGGGNGLFYGIQIEERAFPTTYMRGGSRSGEYATFTTPARMVSGGSVFSFTPNFSSAEAVNEGNILGRTEFVLLYWDDGDDSRISLVIDGSDLRVYVKIGADEHLAEIITFSRNQTITLQSSPNAGEFIISGATTGNGTVGSAVGSWAYPSGTGYIGSFGGGVEGAEHADGKISRIQAAAE